MREMSLVRDEDVPYEQQLIKDPFNIDVWLQYYQFKLSQPDHTTESLIYILSRSLRYLSRSYKLWMIYLNLKIDSKVDARSIVRSFEMALEYLSKFPKFWMLYLNFIKAYDDTQFVSDKFDQSLRELPVPLHFKIWPMYLEFADRIKCFNIYKRFFHFKVTFSDIEKSNYEALLDKLMQYCQDVNLQDTTEIFAKLVSMPDILATVDSEFDIYWKYLVLLMKHHSYLVDDVVQHCITKFPDQKSNLILELAQYYIGSNDYIRLKDVFEDGIASSTTIKDFTAIYESYLEFEEGIITTIMDTGGAELEIRMANFERLLENREFFINDIYLKQDPNKVETWLKRISLFDKSNLKDILETYVKAIMTINAKKVSKGLHLIWIGYIKVYETNGDLNTARVIFSKCVNVPFNDVNDLVEVWLEWSNMELRNDNIDQLIKVLETPLTIQDPSVGFNDTSVPVQSRIFKSFKLWSFYLDLIESSGDIERTSKVYEKMIELKIAKPITLINFASFYEENQMFEKSLSVFEKGLKIFNYPIVFEIWNIYLSKIIKFSKIININKERVRDLFDQFLENCPMPNVHSIILLYADFEESHKNISKMFKIYKQNLTKLDPDSRVIVYKAYISKTIQYLDPQSLRPIYEQIINDDQLPLSQDLLGFVKDFVALEVKLSDLNRARFVLRNFYEFLNQSQNANLLNDLENYWKLFELNNGDEESFKDMLRFKRICEVKFGKLETKVLEGFVKSSEGPKISSIDASKTVETNPDAIELDMDSSGDEDE